MQPYFFPYIGYFHLLQAADSFVLYDNLEYTKKGWINRNRFLVNGSDALFSIPLRKASDYQNIDQREVSEQFDRRKLLNQMRSAYGKAPYFDSAIELFAEAIEHPDVNLYCFIKHSLILLCRYLGLETPIIDSSTVPIDHSTRGQDKVLDICDALGADRYVNAIGGVSLYDHASFEARGIELRFIESQIRPYPQFGHPFVASLSILDVLMFNPREVVQGWVQSDFRLVTHQPNVS